MSNVPLRFAILGCGRMGRHHSERLIEDGRGQVVAVMDPNRRNAEELRDSLWPNAAIFDDLETLTAFDHIDAAILCTPTVDHYPQSLQCLDRGWHVLCEKPLASSGSQIRELVDRGERAASVGQQFSLGYQRRHAALYKVMRAEVQSGRWGQVRSVVSHNVEAWQQTISGTWRDDPAQNRGGFITDAGSHKLDSIFYVTGLKPASVFACTQKRGSHVEIVASVCATLQQTTPHSVFHSTQKPASSPIGPSTFDESVLASISFLGNTHHFGEMLHIQCSEADLMMLHGELWLGRNNQRERFPVTAVEGNPVRSFLDAILEGIPDPSPPAAAVAVYQMTEAVLRSAEKGVTVPVETL
ncbi:MAG: Gfo/Idh/MocA family protein [Planctomyces sp.]|jgi:predicted dehydrogenase